MIFNAFVDITWARNPRCREAIRLSDIIGPSTNPFRVKTRFSRTKQQDRSPDGDWLRLDSISLSKLRKQLQVIRSFDQQKDAIWWSPQPLNTTNISSTAGQARIDNQRDLTWAVDRSFDAPWQDWRGWRIAALRPSQEKYPRFSMIIRDVDNLVVTVVDTSESMYLDDERSSSSGSSVCEVLDRMGGVGESVCGDELADILCAIIKEPVQPNNWALGLLSLPMEYSPVNR